MTSILAALSLGLVLAGCVNLNLKPQSVVWDPPPYYALERYTEINNMKICYLECGMTDPSTIIFIHGLSGNIENWWDQFEDYRDSYHVVIPDLPGHGKSAKPEDFDYSVPAFAKVVVDLMDQLKIPKATLVGNSLGGAIAGYIAIHYPDRVDRLVLSDSAGINISPLLKSVAPIATPTLTRFTGVTSVRQYPGTSIRQRARQDFSASYRGTTEEVPYLKAIDKSLRKVAKFSFEKELPKIKAKTLIIWGSDDETVSFKNAEKFKAAILDSQLYVVDDGGHTPNMTIPREFDCALANFLTDKDLKPCAKAGDAARKEMEKKK